MGTDARILVTGWSSADEAAAAATAGAALLGANDPEALVWGVEPRLDQAGLALVEVATGLRWKPDPTTHLGLRDVIVRSAEAFPGRDLHFTGDDTTGEMWWGDGTLADGIRRGLIAPLDPADLQAPPNGDVS